MLVFFLGPISELTEQLHDRWTICIDSNVNIFFSVSRFVNLDHWVCCRRFRKHLLTQFHLPALKVGASVDPAGVTMLDSIKIYGKIKEQFGWPEEPPEDFSSAPVNNVCSPNLNQGNGPSDGDIATPTTTNGTVLERYELSLMFHKGNTSWHLHFFITFIPVSHSWSDEIALPSLCQFYVKLLFIYSVRFFAICF